MGWLHLRSQRATKRRPGKHEARFFDRGSAEKCGGVAEWLMAVVLKTTIPARVSGVRIPPPPNGAQCLWTTFGGVRVNCFTRTRIRRVGRCAKRRTTQARGGIPPPPPNKNITERWLSGLKQQVANLCPRKGARGFESHPLRHKYFLSDTTHLLQVALSVGDVKI